MLTRRTAQRKGKADQVAKAAAAALTGAAAAPRRRVVRVVRSQSPMTPPAPQTSRSAGWHAPKPENLRIAPGNVTIVAYEGPDMLQLSKFAKGRFTDLCFTPGYGQGVGPAYVSKHFRLRKISQAGKELAKGHADSTSIFTLVAVKHVAGQNIIVGYVQCTMYTAIPGIPTSRIVKIDLICTQGQNPNDRLKGAASLLMDELERYSTDQLGANMLVLDSVDNPSTWKYYLSRGFTRAADQCTHTTNRNAVARRNFEAYRQKMRFDAHPNYLAATQGLYLPDLNTHIVDAAGHVVPDTVFMSKCLRGPKTNRLGVQYGSPVPGKEIKAHFPRAVTRVLAVYGTGIPLPRLSSSGPVPNLFARPATPEPMNRPRRATRSSVSPPVSPRRADKRRRPSLNSPRATNNKRRR